MNVSASRASVLSCGENLNMIFQLGRALYYSCAAGKDNEKNITGGMQCSRVEGAHLDDLLVRFIVNLHRRDHLLYVPQDHVQVLVVSLPERVKRWVGDDEGGVEGSGARSVTLLLWKKKTGCEMHRRKNARAQVIRCTHVKLAPDLALSPQLDVDALVQRQPDEVKRLLHRRVLVRHRRELRVRTCFAPPSIRPSARATSE